MAYVTGTGDASTGCIFCAAVTGEDDEGTRILHRAAFSFVILNTYPYNTGHLMIAPVRHIGALEDLEPSERTELMELTTRAVEVIKEKMAAHGFNIGMNLGEVAGAGIPGHLHVHVVPRWGGDTNFMPIVAETKVLPEMLAETYAKLKPGFAAEPPTA